LLSRFELRLVKAAREAARQAHAQRRQSACRRN